MTVHYRNVRVPSFDDTTASSQGVTEVIEINNADKGNSKSKAEQPRPSTVDPPPAKVRQTKKSDGNPNVAGSND